MRVLRRGARGARLAGSALPARRVNHCAKSVPRARFATPLPQETGVIGDPDTIRTCDLPLRRGTLYPAELRGRKALRVVCRLGVQFCVRILALRRHQRHLPERGARRLPWPCSQSARPAIVLAAGVRRPSSGVRGMCDGADAGCGRRQPPAGGHFFAILGWFFSPVPASVGADFGHGLASATPAKSPFSPPTTPLCSPFSLVVTRAFSSPFPLLARG